MKNKLDEGGKNKNENVNRPTDRKLKANRANALASTGPRTTNGKVRASQNARSHGLSIPVLLDPMLSTEVGHLALKIAGERASSEIQELAFRIAEAQIELLRVREIRQHLLSLNFKGDNSTPCVAKDAERLVRNSSSIMRQLVSISRYERRALSRRKFAIRELDAARTRE